MKVSEGFQVADSRNLPKLNHIMLLEYIHESDCCNLSEIRRAKALLASKESYNDTAVGYVEIKRDGNVCTVKARIMLERKIKAKFYLVTAAIDELDDKLTKVECSECSAFAGGCTHVICFVNWLIKKSDEPSITSEVCYWKKPKLAEAVRTQKYILAKNLGKGKKTVAENINMNVTLSMFSKECKQRNITTGMILKYSGVDQPELNDFSVFNFMLQFVNEMNDHSYDNFKRFCDIKLTTDIVNKIEEATKIQAGSKLWHSMCQGRITGSRIYEAMHCKTDNDDLVLRVLGGYKVPQTKAIQKGKALEKEVLKKLEQSFGVMQSAGIILISPTIAVSLDGLCESFAVEVKCPTSDKSMKNYIKDNQLEQKYIAQILLQMHAAKKNTGLFCVADPSFEESERLHMFWVKYDPVYVKHLLLAAEDYWKKHIFKTILDSAK